MEIKFNAISFDPETGEKVVKAMEKARKIVAKAAGCEPEEVVIEIQLGEGMRDQG